VAEGESRSELTTRRPRRLTEVGFTVLGVVLGGFIGLAGTIWSTQSQIQHAERSELRAERITAYHDYLVANERVLSSLRKLRELAGAMDAEEDPAQLEAFRTEFETLREQNREVHLELSVAADKLYLIGSPEVGSAAVDLIEALGAVADASVTKGDDAASQELEVAQVRHDMAVSKFQSVARDDVGNTTGPRLGWWDWVTIVGGSAVTIVASVVLAVSLVVWLPRWQARRRASQGSH
jgi:hypothetical protein